MDRMTKSVIAVLTIVFAFLGMQVAANLDTNNGTIFRSPDYNTNVERSENTPINSLRDFNDAIVNIAESTNPTVVTVNTAQTVRYRQQSPFDWFFGDPRGGQEREDLRQGIGSGVIVSSEGYIITNNHVVDGAEEITVILFSGDELDAELVGADPESDIAVLKVEAENLPAISIGNSDEVRVGEMVLAIGSPLGQDHTVSMGIVSASGRSDVGLNQFENYIQTDAAINRGNSGGPLINLDGELIGINTAIASSGMGGGNIGIGFAVPSNMVKSVMDALIIDGRVSRGFLGIGPGGEMNRTMARALGLDRAYGIIIGEVVAETPAEEAGLQVGDVILKVNGKEIRSYGDFQADIANRKPGDVVELEIFRDGERETLSIELGERETEELASGEANRDRSDLEESLGFSIRGLNDALRSQLNLDSGVDGVVVAQISQTSRAARQGLQRGDVITQVADTPVTTVNEFYAAMRAVAEDDGVALLRVNRQGRNIFVAFEL